MTNYYNFNYANGYAARETEETVKAINAGGRGRKRIRYEIIKRDGVMTPVIKDITIKELNAYKEMAAEQGSFIL